MKDTIYRQDAINTSLEFFVEYLGGAFDENSQKELMERLQRLPSEESEIIRCRDCKHHRYVNDDIMPYCIIDCGGNGWENDDFCSYAERRENE